MFKGLSDEALSSFKKAVKLNVDMIDYALNYKLRKNRSTKIIDDISEIDESNSSFSISKYRSIVKI